MKPLFKALIALMSLALLLPWYGCGQEAKPFSKTQIEQLVAPIALYPDPLLAQMLMASTYPLEIVEADRFMKAHPKLKKKALEESLLKKTWDNSVKALTALPQILAALNEKLDLTQKLGDAFLAQQEEVLDAVQTLRTKALRLGNLHSGKEQVVDNQHEGESSYITIEPVYPEIIYIPSYDPNIIYGTWPYPSDPPYEYYPSDQDKRRYFGAGLLTGHALWGNVDWNDKRLSIDIGRYNKFNRTNIIDDRWQHRAQHRKGVLYRGLATEEKFGKNLSQGAETRKTFRGRTEQGRIQLKLQPNQSRAQAFEDIDGGREIRNFSKRGRGSRPSEIHRAGPGGGNRKTSGARKGGGRRR